MFEFRQLGREFGEQRLDEDGSLDVLAAEVVLTPPAMDRGNVHVAGMVVRTLLDVLGQRRERRFRIPQLLVHGRDLLQDARVPRSEPVNFIQRRERTFPVASQLQREQVVA